MTETLRRLIAICGFRAGPQDLPASWNLLYALVALDVLLVFAAAAMMVDTGLAAMRVALSTLLTLIFLYLALSLAGYTRRFCQSANAIFGTDLVITLAALPLLASTPQPRPEHATLTDFGILAVNVWSVAVLGHILRHALSIPLVNALLLAFAYALGMVLLIQGVGT